MRLPFLSLKLWLQAKEMGNSMGLILEARRPQNIFWVCSLWQSGGRDHDRRSSVKRARLGQFDVQMMITTVNRVKHLGTVLNELVAVDEND